MAYVGTTLMRGAGVGINMVKPPPPPPPDKSRLRSALSLSPDTPTAADFYDAADEQRAGCRGGRALFSWDVVKADRQRNMYLGNSIKANVWRSARRSDWYEEQAFERDTRFKNRQVEDLEECKREEELARNITTKYGFGALNELEKYKELYSIENASNNQNESKGLAESGCNVSSLKEEMRREKRLAGCK